MGFLHETVLDPDDAIRHIEDAVVMGHEQDGAADLPRHAMQDVDHLVSGPAVQRGRGFVGQNDARLARQGAGYGDALFLPA